MEIAQRLKQFGLACPKCADSVVRRLDLCPTCHKEQCSDYHLLQGEAEESGVSVIVIRCKRYSGV